MKLLLVLLLTACASSKSPPTATTFSCPQDQGICILHEDGRLIAVNSSENPVAVELRILHIKNVELKYRYPFVEFLGPQTSRELLNYSLKKPEKSFAFDYDWNWRLAL